MSELNAMTLNELKDQADILGVKYANNIGEDALRKKLAEELGEFTEDRDPAPATASTEDDDDKVTIMIAPDGQDKQPVFVSVNGAPIRIVRGKKVRVHKKYIQALENAIRVIRDPKTGINEEVMAYPFQTFLD